MSEFTCKFTDKKFQIKKSCKMGMEIFSKELVVLYVYYVIDITNSHDDPYKSPVLLA